MNDYLSSLQVARRLGISSQRVIQLANKGKLAHIRTPLGRLFPTEAVEAFAKARLAKMKVHDGFISAVDLMKGYGKLDSEPPVESGSGE